MVSGELGSAILDNLEAAEDKAADFFEFQLVDQLRLVPGGHGELLECFPSVLPLRGCSGVLKSARPSGWTN